MVLLCTSCTRRGHGEQDHLGGEVTEYVLQNMSCFDSWAQGPFTPSGIKTLAFLSYFLQGKERHSPPHFHYYAAKFYYFKAQSHHLQFSISKLLKCKADSRASLALTPNCDLWTLLRKDYFLMGCVKWERGCREWEQQHVLPPGLGTQLREQQLHSRLDLIKEMRSGENHSI